MEDFLNRLYEFFKTKGFVTYFSLPGLYVNTGIDSWIIDVRGPGKNGSCYVKLYHENHFSRNKKSGMPDMHIQFERECDVEFLTGYIIQHMNKWKPKERS